MKSSQYSKYAKVVHSPGAGCPGGVCGPCVHAGPAARRHGGAEGWLLYQAAVTHPLPVLPQARTSCFWKSQAALLLGLISTLISAIELFVYISLSYSAGGKNIAERAVLMIVFVLHPKSGINEHPAAFPKRVKTLSDQLPCTIYSSCSLLVGSGFAFCSSSYYCTPNLPDA